MTVEKLAKALSMIKPSLQGKEVKVLYPNGEYGPCDIKFVLVDPFNMDKTPENVDYITLQ